MKFFLVSGLAVTVALQASMAATNPTSSCKPVTYLGVSGCELLPDRTCPKGYHVQTVGPTNPQMKAPTRLMCVPDKPSAKRPGKNFRTGSGAKPSL
jgi:hypothetical protein